MEQLQNESLAATLSKFMAKNQTLIVTCENTESTAAVVQSFSTTRLLKGMLSISNCVI